MMNKNLGSLLLAIATALGTPLAVDTVIKANNPTVVAPAPAPVPAEVVTIEGPTHVEIGELITLDLIGESPCWKIDAIDRYDVSPNRVVLSYRAAGVYTVIGSAMANGRPEIIVHVITVAGGIEPVPDPVPNDDPVTIDDNISEDVYNWCKQVDAPKDRAKNISDNFLESASDPDVESINALFETIAAKNRKTDQRGLEFVLANVQQYMVDSLSGKSLGQHVDVFNQIAYGLEKWSQE